MTVQCSICLSTLKHPVCLPCGHLYCRRCLNDHVNVPGNHGLTSTCPDCRATFNLVVPDLNYLPEKYHPFISHAVRRVYLDTSAYTDLQKQLKHVEARLARRIASEEEFMRRCEALTAALNAHRAGEAEANERISEIEDDFYETERNLKEQIGELTARCEELTIENAREKKEAKSRRNKQKTLQERLAIAEAQNAELKQRMKRLERERRESNQVLSSDEDSDEELFSPLAHHQSEFLSLPRLIKPLPRRHMVRDRNHSPPPTLQDRPKRMRLAI
ncbi:unnamed protein product [Cyclocybe aegerita]|uniref:RING-type domain-containing protein n=1 Tax=Cyclocybe aegerita TaxID=1973307 RepID=A0A8S0W4A0_CYCAE|nr:unnamed protein product [Cyclocybe aegerita]